MTWGLLALFALGHPVHAQSNAQSYAATLQSWRDACADPNPDLARGYLADAMAVGNSDVRQVCLREIAASDNRDLASSALRIVVTSLPFTRFRVATPEGYHNNQLLSTIKAGLFFEMANPDAARGTATWLSVVQGSAADEERAGTVRVLGAGIVWSGLVAFGRNGVGCDLAAELKPGTLTLEGVLNCPGNGEFPVASDLLD